MGKKKQSNKRRKISSSEVSNAIRRLKITNIRKAHREETFGQICLEIGRKNTRANRRAVEYTLKQKTKDKLYKRSPKSKYSTSEYLDVYISRRNRISLNTSLPPENEIDNTEGRTTPQEDTKIQIQTLAEQTHTAFPEDNIASSLKTLHVNENIGNDVPPTRRNEQDHETSEDRNTSTKCNNFALLSDSEEDHILHYTDSSDADTIDYEYTYLSNKEKTDSLKTMKHDTSPNNSLPCNEFDSQENIGTQIDENISNKKAYSSDEEPIQNEKQLQLINSDNQVTDSEVTGSDEGPLIPKQGEISMGTLQNIFDVPLEGQKYFQTKIPRTGKFQISRTDWDNITTSSKMRQFKRGNWQHILMEGINQFNPYCTLMIKRHQLNKTKDRRTRKGSSIFHADMYCKFRDCNVRCKLKMFSTDEVQVSFSGEVKHDLKEQWSRPISGKARENVKKQFKHGQKPYKYYMQKFSEIPDDVKIAGNMSHVGSSPEVIRQVASETSKEKSMDEDEWKSIIKMADKSADESRNKVVKGFIQHISLRPAYIFYWNEIGVRLWHDLAKNSVIYWDATGSVVTQKSGSSKYLYYELAIPNPIQGEPTIPVSAMISSSHDTPQIQYWLSKFRLQEKQLYGHANASVPKQVNSDRSLVFLQSALAEFCGETLDDFRSRAWRIITGNGTDMDLKKTIPHGCLSHTMKHFKELCKKKYKSNFEFGMFLLSLLVNVADLETATRTLKSVLTILMASHCSPVVEKAAEYIDSRIQNLPRQTDTTKGEVNNTTKDNICDEDINPNLYSEEDYAYRRGKNEFSEWAEGIKLEVIQEIKKSTNTTPNKRHSPELAQEILKRFISFMPIWSNMLLGNLDRHRKHKEISTEETEENMKKTNAIVEQRFRVLKDISLSGKQVSRLDIFSAELKEHFEAVQKLAALQTLKPRQRHLKRASKTIQESWNKKRIPTEKISSVGKYQKQPKKVITTLRAQKVKQPAKVFATDSNVASSKEMTKNNNVTALPPIYGSNEMVMDKAEKLFFEDSRFARLSVLLQDCPYLKEFYTDLALESKTMDYITSFQEKRTGLRNLGNTCWFNSVVQLFCNSQVMKNMNEMFQVDPLFEEEIRDVLLVFQNTATGEEVRKEHIQRALRNLQEVFQFQRGRQNDAHEFVTKVIFRFFEVNGVSNDIKVKETIICTKCGTSRSQEEVCRDIQLKVAGAENRGSGTIRDLLDDYFSDEELEESLCCSGCRTHRSIQALQLPTDLILTLARYSVSKYDRTVKIRKTIFVDAIINLGKYTIDGNDVAYRLKGAVLHHGNSPRSGHYTTVITDGAFPIQIDDHVFNFYNGKELLTDSYILLYEKIPLSVGVSNLTSIVTCLLETQGLRVATEQYFNVQYLSIRQREIFEQFRLIEVVDSQLSHTEKLCRLLQEGIQTTDIPENQTHHLVRSVLCYLFRDNDITFRRSFGMMVLDVGVCSACGHHTGNESHVINFNLSMSDHETEQVFECPNCAQKSLKKSRAITHFGNTIILKDCNDFLNETQLRKQLNALHYFQPLKSSNVRWTAYLSSAFTLFRHLQGDDGDGNEEDYSLLEKGNLVRSQSKNEAKRIIEDKARRLENTLLFADVTDLNFTSNYVLVSPEPDYGDTLTDMDIEVTTEDKELVDKFNVKMKVGKISLSEEDVQRYKTKEFSDLNIDAYSETLKEKHSNCLFMPAAWCKTRLLDATYITPYQSNNWLDKDLVLIPANLDDVHWVLVAIRPMENLVLYLDPLGHGVLKSIVDRLYAFFSVQYFFETGKRYEESLKVMDLAKTGKYPFQNDCNSCGAFVCLYSAMIPDNICYKTHISSKSVRLFITKEVINAFYEGKRDERFSITDIIKVENLDDIVRSICVGARTSTGRHKAFLHDPDNDNIKRLEGFGQCYLSRKEYMAIKLYLLRRYFKVKNIAYRMITECVFSEAEDLNLVLQRNQTNAPLYNDFVLTSEVLVETLHRKLGLPKEEVTLNCILTEYSQIELVKTEVKEVQERKKKLLEAFPESEIYSDEELYHD